MENSKKNIFEYVLELIRIESSAGYMGGWLEEKRLDFTPLLSRQIKHILNSGTIILLNDQKREWLVKHILSNINSLDSTKPYIPIIEHKNIKNLLSHQTMDNNAQNISLINDMLDISYRNYAFWYIGENDKMLNIAMSKENSFYWLFNEQISGGLFLKKEDKYLDYKLLQLSRIFIKTLHAGISNKIILDI